MLSGLPETDFCVCCPGMELRQLRYFVAVAEIGNISRAARKIFLTQSALSRQIKALEEEIGACLLERHAHSIRLTPAGEALLIEARELLERVEQMTERVRHLGRGARLRVGYAPSLAAGILPVAVENFTQVHPNARVELFDLATNEMLAELSHNRLDVVVSVAPVNETRELRWVPLVRSEWRLVLKRNDALARQKQIAPAAAAKQPLLMFCKRDYPEYWELVIGWFRARRLRPQIAGEYDGVDSLMAAVEAGLGVAVVTTRTADRLAKRVLLKPLATPPASLCIAAGYPANRAEDKPLAVFIEELRKAAAHAE